MKIKRILFTVLTLALLVGSVFAVSASADGEAKPDITVISTNLSYEGDLKLVFAVPADSLGDKVSISVTWTELVGTKKLTKGNVKGPDVYDTSSLPKKTFNNTECVLIASSFGISAKDMGTRLNIEISSDERTFTYENGYSVLEYVYTKLYEEDILNAEAGTADAKRRELYLATINFAKYAEKVLYDNLYDDDENLETHADEWIFSDLEGSPKLYKDGDTITLEKYTKLFEYKVEGGALVKANDAIGFKDDTITLTPSLSLVENPDKTAVLDEIPADENNIIDFTGDVLECKGLIDIQIGEHKHPNSQTNKYVFNEEDRYYYKNEIKPENKTNHYKGEDGVCYEVSIVDGEEVKTPFVEKYYSNVTADSTEGGNSELWYSLSTEVGGRVGNFLKSQTSGTTDYFNSSGIYPSYTYNAGKGETLIVDMDLYYETVNDLPHQVVVYDKQFNFFRRVVNNELCISFCSGYTHLFYLPVKEWVSLRLEITNPDGGDVTDATLKVYLKSSKTNGLLEQATTVSGFKAASQGPFYISDYSGSANTYYIDKISYARVDTTCYHKEIKEEDWIIDAQPNCTDSGAKHAVCGVCRTTIYEKIPANGHDLPSDGWVEAADNANYLENQCTECEHILREEKNTVIASPELKTGTTYYRFDFTDAIHTANVAGGRYLVFDVDVVLKSTEEYTRVFEISIMDDTGNATGNNFMVYYEIIVNGSTILVKTSNGAADKALDTSKYVANGENSITFRVVGELATEKTGSNYLSNYKLYVKNTDSDEPMDRVSTYQRSGGSVGHTGRTGNYLVLINTKTTRTTSKTLSGEYLASVANASFIRTDDTSYYYYDCDHIFTPWSEITPATCITRGEIKRSCTVEGCKHTETEYLPFTDHAITDWVSQGDGTYKKGCVTCTAFDEFTDNITEGTVNFNDGTILGGGNISVNTTTDVTGAGDTLMGNAETRFELSSNIKNKVGYVLGLKVTQANNSSYTDSYMTIDLANADAAGSTYVFEMDYLMTTYKNSGAAIMFNLSFGNDTNNNFGFYTRYSGDAANYNGIGMAIGLRGTKFLTGDWTNSNDKDTSAPLVHNEWVTIRFVLEAPVGGAAGDYTVKIFAKSSKTNGMELLSTTTTTETIAEVPNANATNGIAKRTTGVALDTSYLSKADREDISSVKIAFVGASGGSNGNGQYYFDNISFTKCEHDTVAQWENISEPTCATAGSEHGYCSVCDKDVTRVIPALGHTAGQTFEALEATCNLAGHTDYIICSVCEETVGYEAIPATGHKLGSWSSVDAYYEETACSVCERILRQEKNTPIDFSNGVITNDTSKLSVTFGGMIAHRTKTVNSKGNSVTVNWQLDEDGTYYYVVDDVRTDIKNHRYNSADGCCYDVAEDGTETKSIHNTAPIPVTAGSTSGECLRVAVSVEDAVLKVVHTANQSSIRDASHLIVKATDTLHNHNDQEDGGKYVVFEFDLKFNQATNSTDYPIQPKIYDGNGNMVADFSINTTGSTVYVGGAAINTTLNDSRYLADGKTWMTFRLVTELDDVIGEGESYYKTTTKLFVKLRDTDEPMQYVSSNTKNNSNSTGNIGRTDDYQGRIIFNGYYNNVAYLDNLSVIRTADPTYYTNCQHNFTEEITSAGAAGGKVTVSCTKGCGYKHDEIIPASPVDTSKLTNYDNKYLEANGHMTEETKLVAGKADINTNKHLIFTADVYGSFVGLRVGHGYNNYTSSYIEIDNTYVTHYFYASSLTQYEKKEHGLTIAEDVKVTIDVDDRRVATITVESGEQSYTFSTGTTWYGASGEIYAQSLGSILPNAQIAFTSDNYASDLQFYGDSYLSISRTSGWLGIAYNDGYFTDALVDGYGGRSSGGAIESLIENLKHSTPKYVVWMLGMNDGSDTNLNTPSAGWASGRDRLIELSQQYGFEIIFTTIPTVPTINHEAKNKWIRESGYRYIDMAAALGADGTGAWTEGYIRDDNIHPNATGAAAISACVKEQLTAIIAELEVEENKETPAE